MSILLAALVASLAVTLWVVRAGRSAGHAAHDSDLSGPQKIHAHPVPRIGGVGIVSGVLAGSRMATAFEDRAKAWRSVAPDLWLPCFLAGLVEDFTKRVSPRRRLFSTAVSAIVAVCGLQSMITYTTIPGLDWVVSVPIGAALVTVFVVTGVANSVNIIDGFNGLSSMCATLMLGGVRVCRLSGRRLIGRVAGAGGYQCAWLGFFIWNYPAGLVFLGDGGAYFVGFYVAEVAILLLHRNPQVSPMFPLLACIYPVFETLFSMYRRRVLRARSPGVPDGIHLHSLIYRRSCAGQQALARGQGVNAAQLDDVAVPMAAMHVRRGARPCCSGTTLRCWLPSSCCSAWATRSCIGASCDSMRRAGCLFARRPRPEPTGVPGQG